jgi:large conductance mechanosensitive channel
MKWLQEFKTFAIRGNVVDMAVGIVIGAAFGKIVSSIVADVIMPPIGVLIGGKTFTNLAIILKQAKIDEAGKTIAPAVTLNYGNFIQTVIDFTFFPAGQGNQCFEKKRSRETGTASPAIRRSCSADRYPRYTAQKLTDRIKTSDWLKLIQLILGKGKK